MKMKLDAQTEASTRKTKSALLESLTASSWFPSLTMPALGLHEAVPYYDNKSSCLAKAGTNCFLFLIYNQKSP